MWQRLSTVVQMQEKLYVTSLNTSTYKIESFLSNSMAGSNELSTIPTSRSSGRYKKCTIVKRPIWTNRMRSILGMLFVSFAKDSEVRINVPRMTSNPTTKAFKRNRSISRIGIWLVEANLSKMTQWINALAMKVRAIPINRLETGFFLLEKYSLGAIHWPRDPWAYSMRLHDKLTVDNWLIAKIFELNSHHSIPASRPEIWKRVWKVWMIEAVL